MPLLPLTPAAARQQLIGPDGRFTRDGVLFLNQLLALMAEVQGNTDTITGYTDTGAVNPFEAANTARDFTPAIQDTQTLNGSERPRLYDDAELRGLLASVDPPVRPYDDSDLRQALASVDPLRVYDDSDLRQALASVDPLRVYDDNLLTALLAGVPSPSTLGLQQQMDDLRVMLAAVETPQYSAYQTWTPTFSASGSMTVSSVSILVAQFFRVGPMCHFFVGFNCTLGGTASTDINILAPLEMAAVDFAVLNAAGTPPSGTQQLMQAYLGGSTQTIILRLNPQANWPLGTVSAGLRVSGTYQV